MEKGTSLVRNSYVEVFKFYVSNMNKDIESERDVYCLLNSLRDLSFWFNELSFEEIEKINSKLDLKGVRLFSSVRNKELSLAKTVSELASITEASGEDFREVLGDIYTRSTTMTNGYKLNLRGLLNVFLLRNRKGKNHVESRKDSKAEIKRC